MRKIYLLIFAFLIVTLHNQTFSEPVENAANEFGLWHPARPGRFVPLDQPSYVSLAEAQLPPETRVIGVTVGGEARAFPIRLMAYHHVVNDQIGGENVAVTYCVMANTAVCYALSEDQAGLEAGGLFGGVLALREQGTGNCWPQIAQVTLPEDHPTSPSLKLGPTAILSTL